MNNRVIKKLIKISAPPEKVWRVFTDPALASQMGGAYVSNWEVGGPLGWKGLDGTMYTRGIILQLQPARLLKHNLFDLGNEAILLSTITYEFQVIDDKTMILAKEELHYKISDEQFREISLGWNIALRSVKEIAEKL